MVTPARAIALLCSLLLAAAAHSAPILDQEHAPTGNFGSLAVASDRTQIQTFTVGIAGALTRIDAQVSRLPLTEESVDLSVWSTDGAGLPKDLLATASVPASALDPTAPFPHAFIAFNLSAPVPVAEGDVLAIELNSKAPNSPPSAELVRYHWDYGGQYVRGTSYTQLGSAVLPNAEDLHFRTFVEPLIRVTIDIQRGKGNDRINPRSQGMVLVSILSTDDFDATMLDVSTVRFGKTGAEAAAVNARAADVNGDRRPDLVLHFRASSTGIQCGDTVALISGKTVSGQSVQGSDAVETVGCK